jgi:GxxExxY protein
MTEVLYKELSYRTVGAAVEVHSLLGPGFLEIIYEQALAHEFGLRKIPFERQVSLAVMYKDICVGEYRADFVIDHQIILEIKAGGSLLPAHSAQALHYLAATGFHLAILLNFGAYKLQMKRVSDLRQSRRLELGTAQSGHCEPLKAARYLNISS